MKVKVAQPCPTLCNPMDYIVHGILQARILEGVAFPFSRGSSQPRTESRSPALQVDSLPAEPQELLFQSGPGRNHPPIAPCLQVRKLHSLPPLTKQRKPSHLFQKVYDDCTFWLFFSLATGYREMRKRQKRQEQTIGGHYKVRTREGSRV